MMPLMHNAGFTHSAFVFGCESTVSKVNIDGKDVPIGALVSFIQKGFQFMELEANLTEDGTDVYGKYTTLSARDILTKDLKELREAARELKLRDAVSEPAEAGGAAAAAVSEEPIELASTSLRKLEGHTAEILSISWSQKRNLLATGSADGTARIWNPSAGTSTKCTTTNSDADDMIISVEWSPNGTLLAAITANGALLLWDATGNLKHSISNPSLASTLALQWSTLGTYVATGCTDGSIYIWDPISGAQKQTWTIPGGAPIYDLHWRDDNELAAAGEDGCVAIYNVNRSDPVRSSKEHGIKMEEGENGAAHGGSAMFPGAPNAETVNMVRWDSTGNYLATAANDMTIGLWNRKDGTEAAPRLLSGHKREVGWVSWSSNGSSGGNGGGGVATSSLLASGSSDGSVRIWNATTASAVGVLDRHEENITCVTWSPQGGHIAAGDAAGNVTVWEVESKKMVCTVRGSGSVADVQWLVAQDSDSSSSQLVIAFGGNADVVIAKLPILK
jgi:transducin (beta)-like 1